MLDYKLLKEFHSRSHLTTGLKNLRFLKFLYLQIIIPICDVNNYCSIDSVFFFNNSIMNDRFR